MFESIHMATELQRNNFVRRGTAFFRVCGDGTLQIVKMQRFRHGIMGLQLGLHSLYAQLHPQWFTSPGCIPRYSIMNVVGERFLPGNMGHLSDNSINDQITVLLKHGFPWLNSMETQQQLVDGMCYLETCWGGDIIWVDEQKIAPYLYCENYSSAERVITSILEQNKTAYHFKRNAFSPAEYQKYLQSHQAEDKNLEELLHSIQKKDKAAIRTWLMNNYDKNKVLARFVGQTNY